jgi:phosphohistidine phosphatase
MRLFILRHAIATDPADWTGPDEDRPLTPKGSAKAAHVLASLAPLITADEIHTSPWLRARQTAELACHAWKLPLRPAPWLAGNAATAAERAARLQGLGNVVLVGHEPDLGDLIRYLCGARIQLKKCGLAILDGVPEENGMELIGLFAPKAVLAL